MRRTVVGWGLLAVAVGLFLLATRTASLPLALMWFLIGAAAGTVGILWAIPGLARRLGFGDGRGGLDFESLGRRLFGFATFGFGAVATIAGLVLALTPLLILGLVVAGVGAGFIDIQIDQGKVPASTLWVMIGVSMMLIGAFLAVSGVVLPLGVGHLGPALVFLGFPVIKVGLPGALHNGDDDNVWSGALARVVEVASLVTITVGGIALLAGALQDDPPWLWVAVGFSLVSIGYALVVEIGLLSWPHDGTAERRAEIKSRGRRRFLLPGALLLVLGVLLANQLTTTWESYAFVLTIVAFAIGAFFVLRGEAGLFVLVVGLVLVWVTWDRTVGPQEFSPTEESLVIGIGDSYIAGQGASRFYDYNNTALPRRELTEELVGQGGGDPIDLERSDGTGPPKVEVVDGGTECRRSPLALPAALADRQGDDWGSINLACSGARMADVDKRVKYPYGDRESESGRTLPGTMIQLEELAGLDQGVKDRIRLIVLSVGGNDSGFSKVIMACLLPVDCTSQVKALEDDLPSSVDGLRSTYEAVAEVAAELRTDGEVPPVVVIPYPEFLDDQECGLTVSPGERDAVLQFQRKLNSQVVTAAEAATGVEVFEDGQRAYGDDLKLCHNGGDAERAGANFLYLMPHDPLGGLSPAKWVQGSMHPRPAGHERMADVFLCWRDGSTDCVDGAVAEVGETDETTPSSEDIDTWTDRNVRVSVTRVAGALALVMGGGLLIALGLFHTVGRWLGPQNWFKAFFPRPPQSPRPTSP